MADDAQGLKTAVELAVAEAGEAVPAGRAEQLPLLPAVDLAGLPLDDAGRRRALQAPRGRGRPAGALNKSTQAWRDWLLARYPSPLQALAEAYSRPAGDLARELGCKPLEAFQVQMRAAAELAPYLHGKMPVEVNVTAGALPLLMLADPAAMVAAFQQAGEGGEVLDLGALRVVGESEENQGVGEGGGEPVGRRELDGDGKGEGNQ